MSLGSLETTQKGARLLSTSEEKQKGRVGVDGEFMGGTCF